MNDYYARTPFLIKGGSRALPQKLLNKRQDKESLNRQTNSLGSFYYYFYF